MSLSAQLGSLQLGVAQLGSDGAVGAPSITWSGASSGNAGQDSGDITVTYNNPGVDVTVTVASSEATDAWSSTSAVIGVSNPSATFHLVAPVVIGERTLSITNNGGLSNPADLTYTVLAVAGATSQLGQAALGSMRLGADSAAFIAGVPQLYLRPAVTMHGSAGRQSGAMVVGILNPGAGDTHVVMSNVGVTGTWSSGPTLNNATREALVYFTPTAGTSGLVTVSATADNGAGSPPESLTYLVDGTTFYVSSAGSDSNNGQSPLTPWQTAAKVSSYGVVRGGTYNFYGLETFNPCRIVVNDGNDGSNLADLITIQSYGTGKATLKNTNITQNCVQTLGIAGGVHLQSIIFEGEGSTPSSSNQFLVAFSGSGTRYNLTMDDCEFKNAFGGYAYGLTYPAALDAPSVTNSDFHDLVGIGGILLTGNPVGGTYTYTNLVLSGNRYWNINGNTTAFASQQSMGQFILDTNGATINGLLFRDLALTSANGGAGIVTAHCNALLMDYIEGYNIFGSGTSDAYVVDLDWSTRNSRVRFVYANNCDAGGIAAFEYSTAGLGARLAGAPQWSDNHFSFCVVQNCAKKNFGAFSVLGANMQNCFVYHSTFITTAGGGNAHVYYDNGVAPVSGCVGFWFLNCVFLGSSTAVKVAVMAAAAGTNADQHWLNNSYYATGGGNVVFDWRGSTYTGVAAWQSATSQDANAITTNPSLNDPFTSVTLNNPSLIGTLSNFTPSSGASPVVGTGLNLTAAPYSIGGIVNAINNRPASNGGVYDVGAAKFIASANAVAAYVAMMNNQGVIA